MCHVLIRLGSGGFDPTIPFQLHIAVLFMLTPQLPLHVTTKKRNEVRVLSWKHRMPILHILTTVTTKANTHYRSYVLPVGK